MDPGQIGDLLERTIMTIFTMSMPLLLVGLVIGFVISLFQAATQINEVTLVFIPKMLGIGLVLWLAGPSIYEELVILVEAVREQLQAVGTSGGML